MQLDPVSKDLLVRTVIGEAGNQSDKGKSAVAHVILNRLASGQWGNSVHDVVLAPHQFEPWQTRTGELLSYSPSSKIYQKTGNVIDGALDDNSEDPTGGATHFLDPKIVMQRRGGSLPDWAQGSSVAIGDHNFYAPGNPNYGKENTQEAQMSDPFKEYPTSEDVPSISAAQVAPESQSDPFKEYPTSESVNRPAEDVPAISIQNNQSGGPGSAARMGAEAIIGGIRSIATGVPIVGGLLNRADAATNALIAPVLNPLFSKDQQLSGNDFSERYANALGQQNSMDAAFENKHPIANTALNIGGAVAGTIPAMMSAPAVFGIGEAPLAVNALTSAASSGAINFADTGIRTGGDLGAMERAGVIGASLGAAAPFFGAAVGSGINKLSNFFGKTTPEARNVSSILESIGMTPDQAKNALQKMGPNSTLADIDPALTTEAAGLARMGGKPTSILKGAMAQRAAGADDRISQIASQTLGARPDLTAAKNSIAEKASNAASPFYNAARASNQAMDVTPVLSDIDNQLKNAVGGESAVLNKAKSYLIDQKVGLPGPDGKPTVMSVPKSDPMSLLKVRQQLDDDISSLQRNGTIDGTSAGKNAYRAASGVRNHIDAVLKSDPNIAAGDKAFSSQIKNLDSIDEGTDLFKPNIRIEDIQRSLKSKTPEQIESMKSGALSAIHDSLDNARQGDLSAARSLFAKSSANRAKLDALFPNSGKFFDRLDGELAMRGTEQRVSQNSVTAEAQAVGKKYSPPQDSGGNLSAPILGELVGGTAGAIAVTGAKTLYGGLRNAFTEAARNRLIEGTARALSATGSDQRAFFNQLDNAYRINPLINSLAEHASNLTNVMSRNALSENHRR